MQFPLKLLPSVKISAGRDRKEPVPPLIDRTKFDTFYIQVVGGDFVLGGFCPSNS